MATMSTRITMRCFKTASVLALSVGMLSLPAIVLAAEPSSPQIVIAPAGPEHAVVARHTGTFNGKAVAYDATIEPIVVADASGKPAARLQTISYVAAGAPDRTRRPVLFVFNGGPIGPSSVLHMGAFGPKRVAIPDDLSADPSTFKVVDNPYTVLDVADIVFFDPASTGFSRVLPGVDPKNYFSVTADAQQTAQLIVEWCRLHGRMDSPKYVLGESYGTMRAAATAQQLQTLPAPVPLNGVILLGQALNIIEFSQRPANVTSYVVSLPTIASIAWSHGKIVRRGLSFDQFESEVERFADREYLQALFQGSGLDDRTRRRIADRLERYTGLPASFYLANGLKITKERYRRELLKGDGLILGMMDARYSAPMTSEGTDASVAAPRAYDQAFGPYIHSALSLGDVGPYVTEDPVPGDIKGWDWGYGGSPFADWPYMSLLGQVYAANPGFRVMVGNGWQDTQTTVGAARLMVAQSGWPRERTSLHFYQGGHMFYSVENSLKLLTDDVRAFVSGH